MSDPVIARKVEKQLLDEIQSGNYIISDKQSKMLSALSVVDKPNGAIWIIHDLSRPAKGSLNDSASKDSFSYQTLHDAF